MLCVHLICSSGRLHRESKCYANEHHDDVAVDCTRAYHFGAAYIVEMEILMPPETLLRDSHDIALDLQQKLEGIDEIERAFVHVVHTHRDVPEHKV
jgi:divalent metal cation (Fe/Co/Zn/Cd) transporter